MITKIILPLIFFLYCHSLMAGNLFSSCSNKDQPFSLASLIESLSHAISGVDCAREENLSPLRNFYQDYYQNKVDAETRKDLEISDKKMEEIVQFYKGGIKGALLPNLWRETNLSVLEYGSVKYTQKEGGKNQFIVGDIHGDLHGLLAPLILSGIAQIDPKKPYKLINSATGEEVLLNPYDAEKVKMAKLGKIIKIPNLSLMSPLPQNKEVVLLGDLVDRGDYTPEIFFIAKDLLDKQEKAIKNEKDKVFKVVLGNHELMLLESYLERERRPKSVAEYGSQYYGESRLATVKSGGIDIGKHLYQMLRDKKITPTYAANGVLFSHSFISTADFKKIKEEKILSEVPINQESSDYVDSVDKLSKGINDSFWKALADDQFDTMSSVVYQILWNRLNTNVSEGRPLYYLQQGIGHEQIGNVPQNVSGNHDFDNETRFRFHGTGNNIICFDIGTSHAYTSRVGLPSVPAFGVRSTDGKIYQWRLNIDRSNLKNIPQAFYPGKYDERKDETEAKENKKK